MNFEKTILEITALIVSLALAGLVLSRADEVKTIATSVGKAFANFMDVAMKGAD